MRNFVLGCLVVFMTVFGSTSSFGAQALKKDVQGSACVKGKNVNPVWSFKPDNQATDGNFELKFGQDQAGTTGLCPNRPAYVFAGLSACNTPITTLENCSFYFQTWLVAIPLTTNANGNLLLPLNGQDILNAGGQAFFQAFVIDGDDICDPAFPVIRASPLVAVYDKDWTAPVYSCP
jgi:hypothetical protein